MSGNCAANMRLESGVVMAFPQWPYGEKRVVVLSSRPLDLSKAPQDKVEQMSGAPAEIVAKLATRGAQHLYVDGGVTVQRFLRAGLIQHMTVTRVPVLIGDGLPLFGALSSRSTGKFCGTSRRKALFPEQSGELTEYDS